MRAADADPAEIEALLWEGFGLDDGTAWDVGANVGQSVPKLLSRFARVVSFEPAEESFRVLDAAWGYHDNVLCVQAALSDETGGIDLVVASEKIDSGQLVTANQYPEALTNGATLSDRHVPSFTGDMFCAIHGEAAPDFMKIDVEGHEDKVLEGCTGLLDKHHPDLLIEIHTEALGNSVSKRLIDLGYDFQVIRHPHYEMGSAFYWGHFWIRAKQRVVVEFARPWS